MPIGQSTNATTSKIATLQIGLPRTNAPPDNLRRIIQPRLQTTRKTNANRKMGNPRIHTYAHPNTRAHTIENPLSGIGPVNAPMATPAQPNKLRSPIVIRIRPNDFTHGDLNQIKRQRSVGGARSIATSTAARTSTACKTFNNQHIVRKHYNKKRKPRQNCRGPFNTLRKRITSSPCGRCTRPSRC